MKFAELAAQNCVLVESAGHREILPTRLCSVLPRQYCPLPAGDYFRSAEEVWQKCLVEHLNKCVLGMDGHFTKLLKCSTSPTTAQKFKVKTPGYGEISAFRAKLCDNNDRMLAGQIVGAPTTATKKDEAFSRPVLVLVFAATELPSLKNRKDRKDLENLLSKGFSSQPRAVAVKVSTHNIHDHVNEGIGRLIEEAKIELWKEHPKVVQKRPAIIGIFCKPGGMEKARSATRQELDSDRLRQRYRAVKLYCHKTGYPFAGTFSPTLAPKHEFFNAVLRSKTQVQSANAATPLTQYPESSCKVLMLGIHVSELQSGWPECFEDGKHQAAGWYLVSIVAKWSGSNGFHKARTFLQRSCATDKKCPYEYPGALAMMDDGQDALQELVHAAPLEGSTIVVFRAGTAAGTAERAEYDQIRAVMSSRATRQAVKKAAGREAEEVVGREAEKAKVTVVGKYQNETLPLVESEGWRMAAEDPKRLAQNSSPSGPADISDAEVSDSGCTTTEGESLEDQSVARSTTEGTSPDRGQPKEASDPAPISSTEMGSLKLFAKAHRARLAYVEVGARTRARLFDQWGDPLFATDPSIVNQKGRTIIADGGPASGRVVSASEVNVTSRTSDWLVQKIPEKRPEKKESVSPNKRVQANTMPVRLKLQYVPEEIIKDRSLVNSLSEASWDFPAGTWSSKDLSCVALAKKANRHGMRVVEFVNGTPVLPPIHPDLKDSLYFI